MDYGFAPLGNIDLPANKREPQAVRALVMFQLRSDTKAINSGPKNLQDFIKHLNTEPGILRPVGDLLLGAHAVRGGWIGMQMYPGQKTAYTNFETLEETLTNPAKSVVIPDPLIGYSGGNVRTHAVHFKGCNIGQSRAFLVKLQEAFGDNVRVSAPKYFHDLSWENDGVYESMAYEFALPRKEVFADRASAISEFNNGNFRLIDTSPVPLANWEDWIPKRIGRATKLERRTPLGITLGRRTTLKTLYEFRISTAPYTRRIPFPDPGSVPTSEVDRLQALESELQIDFYFRPTHPFPMYERWGYRTVADFFAGFTWRFKKIGSHLHVTGSRVKYTVAVPITDLATGDLIFNFYKKTGSPLVEPAPALTESDTDFFEQV